MTFVEYAGDTFIKEAEKYGHKPGMIRVFREESDEQLTRRVLGVIGKLEASFAWQNKTAFIDDEDRCARQIVALLKERLASEIVQPAPV